MRDGGRSAASPSRGASVARRLATLLAVTGLFLARPIPAADQDGEGRGEDPGLESIRELIRRGDYARAETEARSLLGAVEAIRGSESIEAADVLDVLVEALWRGGKAARAESRALAERAVALHERLLGGDHVGGATSVYNLGALLRRTGDLAAARPLYERALAMRERSLGPDHPDVVSSLNGLAVLLRDAGDEERSTRLYERALEIGERSLGPEHPTVLNVLNNLANVVRRKGDVERAGALYERVLAAREKVLGPEHPDVAASLLTLALLRSESGDLPGARALQERAAGIYEKALGPDHPDVANALNNLANTLADMGENVEARARHERILAIRERVLGPDHPDVAQSLHNLGLVLHSLGDDAGARPLLRRALAIRERTFGADHPLVGETVLSLAGQMQVAGDHAEARLLYERALRISEKAFGAASPPVAMALNNLAGLEAKVGAHAEARRLYERALRIWETALPPGHPFVAVALVNLGEMLQAGGAAAEAAPLFERALEIQERSLGPDHPETAQSLIGLASSRSRAGDADEAARLYGRALAVQEKALGPSHPALSSTLQRQAELWWLQGRKGETLEASLRGAAVARMHFRSTVGVLTEREALAFEAVRTSVLDLALSVLTRSDARRLPAGSAGRVVEEVIRSRAMVLDELGARRRGAAAEDRGETAPLVERFDRARQRLARLVVLGPGKDPRSSYRARLDKARREAEEAERLLAEASVSRRRDLERREIGLAAIRRALPAGSALVAYLRFNRWLEGRERAARRAAASTEGGRDLPESEPAYMAIVLLPDGRDPRLVEIGRAEAIDPLIEAWRMEVTSARRGLALAGSPAESRYRESARRLREAVWDPVMRRLGRVTRIFIVPDGGLNLVNVAALPGREDRYLAEEGPSLHYLSTERDLIESGDRPSPGSGLLVLGHADFEAAPEARRAGDAAGSGALAMPAAPAGGATSRSFRGATTSCVDFRRLRFDPLPHSGTEVGTLASLWEQKLAGEADPENGVLRLTGARADEATFKESAPGRRVLHLATHGFFVQDRCEAALERVRAGSGRPPAVAGSGAAAWENPLWLSGLALAGANRRQEAGRDEEAEDGILTAEEIAALDLSGVEWAVLSACETGVGQIVEGEGVLGLRRAFQVAGVGTLIMSLWPVEDRSTLEWMSGLYEARLSGSSTADAVRKANLAVLEARRRRGLSTHPFFWGAFVAAGDWR